MIKKRIAALLLAAIFITVQAFAQNAGTPANTAADEQTADKTETATESAKKKLDFHWIFTMGPVLIVNTESYTKSAPSPIAFSCGLGMKLMPDNFYSYEPRISFFTNYYLWDGENALPAEVENRTATAISFLIDLPVVFNFKKSELHSFEAGAGLALLARYGILSNGVSSSDSGASGDAGGDVNEINSWFWSGMHYLFPEITGAWNFKVNEKLKAGLETHIYFPLGSLTNGRGLDAMMVTVAARLMF